MTHSTGPARWTAILLAAIVALGAAIAPDAKSAEYNTPFPKCVSGSVERECLAEVLIDGQPTDQVTAAVQVQKDVGGDAIAVYITQARPYQFVPPGTPAPPGGWPSGTAYSCETRFTPGNKCSDLTGFVPIGARVTVNVTIGDREPVAATIRGAGPGELDAPNKTWNLAESASGGNLLSLDMKAQQMAQLQGPDFGACRVFPVANDCGGESGIAEWSGVYMSAHFLQLDSPDWARQRQLAGGLTIATNAQTNGPPLFDTAKRTLSIQTGGPHFLPDGTTVNEGSITTFLPKELLEAPEGFALPPGLSPEEAKALLTVEKSEVNSGSQTQPADVSVSSDGAFYTVPNFSFSAPKFSYARTNPTGLLTGSAAATKRGITVRVLVGGPARISFTGKLGKRRICTGSAKATKESSLRIPCRLSPVGRKTLKKARKGSKLTVRASAKSTDGKNTKLTIIARTR